MNFLVNSVRIEFGEEAAKEVTSVVRVLRSKIVARNLFGWTYFLDDVLIDMVSYMIQTEFVYSGGAYVAVGMQAAIDACRYCNAQKRKANYQAVSIEKVEAVVGQQQYDDYQKKLDILINDIREILGDDIAIEIERYLAGDTQEISKETLNVCRNDDFISFLRTYVD